MMQREQRERGVSLIELLVAVAILTVGLIPLLSVFTHALKTAEHGNKRMLAMNLARDLQEEIRSRAFTEPDSTDLPTLASDEQFFPIGDHALPFGLEEGSFDTSKGRIEQFDDVDDYNGWCRGKECVCTGTEPTNVCLPDAPLEDFSGERYTGGNYPRYNGFTRSVEVYNVYANVDTPLAAWEIEMQDNGRPARSEEGEPWKHEMTVGADDKQFYFYDLREKRINANSDLKAPDGLSRLKIIRVTVMYDGSVTPPITMMDSSLAVMPVREGEVD